MANDMKQVCKGAMDYLNSKGELPSKGSNLVLLNADKWGVDATLLYRLRDKLEFLHRVKPMASRSDELIGAVIGEALADVMGYCVGILDPDSSTVRTEHHIKELSGHKHPVDYIEYSPDGRYMVSLAACSNVTLWDTATGKRVKQLSGCPMEVTAVTFSSDSKLMAVANCAVSSKGPDGEGLCSIKVLDVETGEFVYSIDGIDTWFDSLSWSPDNRSLAFNGEDNGIEIWDTESRTRRVSLAGNTGRTSVVRYSPDGTFLASGDSDGCIWIWDGQTSELIRRVASDTSKLYDISWSPDSKFLAAGGSTGIIYVLDTNTWEVAQTLEAHVDSVRSIGYSPNGKFIVSGSADSTVRVWDIATEACVKTFTRGRHDVSYARWAPDGKHIACGGWGKTVSILDVDMRNE